MKKETSRWQKWQPYIRSIADQVGLRDWTIAVLDEPTSSKDGATIDIPYCRRHANISLSERFAAFPRTEQRYLVVHELVHAHIETYVEAVRAKTSDDPTLYRLMELAVDGIAAGFAPHLPLPPAKL